MTSKSGPRSVTRHVLLTLSLHMSLEGHKCFPTTKTLSRETGLSERTVCTHLKIAEEKGWIKKSTIGNGKGWRRSTYKATLPRGISNETFEHVAETGSAATSSGTENGSARKSVGTEPHDSMVLKEVQSNSSYNSPSISIYSHDSDALRLSASLAEKIHDRNPKFKKPNLQKWAVHIDRAMRVDHRTKDDLSAVINWCQEDAFWQNNILSTEKLRKHFDTLFMKMNGEMKNGRNLRRRHDGNGTSLSPEGTGGEKYKRIGRIFNTGE